nr:putative ribonuclease H-like domain-containing protein [Tanacetum cinerariifolium]
FTWTFFLKTKDETSGILRNFITEIENLKELRVKIIRCDNGGDFRNKKMNDFCSRKGIKKEFSNARTPQQNEVAERRNRTLIEAHLESSTSNAQDTCSADAPESSGISNPTATSKNPPADHMETLVVFEDILGVTTNTDDTNGVEADLGNMETTITASPTPTLRIHKDHQKSQIIGPVDTPIQTRNKSKEMKEQSFIATIN